MARPVDTPTAPIGPADAATLLRHAREAAALRENLRRRKQQVRARQQPCATDPAADLPSPDPSRLPD